MAGEALGTAGSLSDGVCENAGATVNKRQAEMYLHHVICGQADYEGTVGGPHEFSDNMQEKIGVR
jgi:hypothetical protein